LFHGQNPDKNSEFAEDHADHLKTIKIVIVTVRGNKVGIIIDSILGNEEIVVKPIPEFLQHLPMYSGTTILGDGSVVLILDVPGFIESNELKLENRAMESSSQDDDHVFSSELQSILIFNNNTEENFAITIPLIQRVDTIARSDIQYIGNKEYINYQGEQMRILRLENYLPIQKPTEEKEEYCPIIIPKDTQIPIGILIHEILDTRVINIEMSETIIQSEGILGSTLIDDKITLMIDLFSYIEKAEPEAIKKVSYKKKKSLKDATILVVEDTVLFMQIIKTYIATIGCSIITATNGKEALEILENHDVDLVLSDIEMPIMDGFTFVRNVRSKDKWKDLPIIALTAVSDEKSIQDGKDVGFNDWKIKFHKQDILSCLVDYL